MLVRACARASLPSRPPPGRPCSPAAGCLAAGKARARARELFQ